MVTWFKSLAVINCETTRLKLSSNIPFGRVITVKQNKSMCLLNVWRGHVAPKHTHNCYCMLFDRMARYREQDHGRSSRINNHRYDKLTNVWIVWYTGNSLLQLTFHVRAQTRLGRNRSLSFSITWYEVEK